ncbi:MAG: prolipoprotein diacylglyceryl transferase [Bacteroides graminisolvens]|nr:prolipoprotein diacylglyceryl transferase [Bacteroides graminisolvens]
MNHLLATIHWNPNPELFNLLGISIRYYGLLWAVGILFAYLVVHYQYRDKKIGEDKFEPLFFYCFFWYCARSTTRALLILPAGVLPHSSG